MVRAVMGLPDVHSRGTGIWLLYGIPRVNEVTFIWSRSSWSWQKLRDVSDVLD